MNKQDEVQSPMRGRAFFLSIFLCICPSLAHAQSVTNGGIDLSGFSTSYYSLPFIDFDQAAEKHIVIDKEPGQYLGHPTTVLMEDGQTDVCCVSQRARKRRDCHEAEQ